VASSPTDRRLLAAGCGRPDGSYVCLWDIDAGTELARLPAATNLPGTESDVFTGAVGALAFSPDGKYLVAGFGGHVVPSLGGGPGRLHPGGVEGRRCPARRRPPAQSCSRRIRPPEDSQWLTRSENDLFIRQVVRCEVDCRTNVVHRQLGVMLKNLLVPGARSARSGTRYVFPAPDRRGHAMRSFLGIQVQCFES
jgi:hypothetical protein